MFYAPADPPVQTHHWWLLSLWIAAAAGCGDRHAAALPGVAASQGAAALCRRIDAVVAHARDARILDADVHGAWQVVHGILAFGPRLQLSAGGTESAAVAYLLGGGRLAGWVLRPGRPGFVAVVEEGSTTGQGHPDQWLGYFAQCGAGAAGPAGLPLDTPLVVAGRTGTLGNLLAQAQHDIRPGREASWTLMALAAYVPPDASWIAGDGSRWDVERVVQMEAEADIFGAACGGAHRVYGLAAAVVARRRAGLAIPAGSGWAAAAAVLEEMIDRARRFQQADGSFSIHPFERPGSSPDVFACLGASGHVFEILALALDDERLGEPWVTRAADRIVRLLEQTADLDVECGALYHAVHGLTLYRRRVCTPASSD